jgi:hypothetical protein
MQQKDILQLMLDATGEEGGEEEDENADGKSDKNIMGRNGCPVHKKEGVLSDEEVVMHAIMLLMAGYETTANALAYTSYLLALNPDVQEKLQSEIDTYFDENPVSLWLILCHKLIIINTIGCISL